ncbi:MAG: lytic murein transglycosylase, partial [Pseudomonadota bacterium]|nr:lytic murein transglycosylase [Pseudomonadota bacterium]
MLRALFRPAVPLTLLSLTLSLTLPPAATAATCGNSAVGFQAWKQDFASYARKKGVKQRGLAALAGAQYASRTIAADRNQKSFRYSLDKFMQIRGATTIVAQGRKRKAQDAAFFAALEKRYGVPAGVILAIHGMETGFGRFMGDSNVVDAITTLAYDCRRPGFFTPHALAALQLVDRGGLSAGTLGAKHGEVGHTQFLPGNILKYG